MYKKRKLAKAKPLIVNKHFETLIQLVCDVYGVDKTLVMGGMSLREFTVPRNIIATIWSRADTMHNTARMIGWRSHQQVFWAHGRVQTLLTNPTHAARMQTIIERLAIEMPWLIAVDESDDEIKHPLENETRGDLKHF